MFAALTPDDLEIVHRALQATVEGPFFEDDDEFQTVFGVTKRKVAEVLSRFPALSSDDSADIAAVSGALGNLLGYPHGRSLASFGLTLEQLQTVLSKLHAREAIRQ